MPPGKFIERNLKTGTWHEVDDKRAYFKTSQALRERVHQHADKRSRSPVFQKKIDDKQDFCESSLSHQNIVVCPSRENDFRGFFDSATHGTIPELSKITQNCPIVNQVTVAKRYSESSFKKKVEINQATNIHNMQHNLFMKPLPPFSSKDLLQEPFIELSYALNHAVNVRFRLTKIKCSCALERNPYAMEEHSTECHDISTVIKESKLEEKDILHPDLHVVNRPASSVQHVTADSDALCEALLENFIRENLSDNEVKPTAGSS